LRALADTAERHGVSTIKITGAQRVDLLGVQKTQLPAIWSDLNAAGFVSGHAYARAVRAVKTCVGSEWCRYGILDAVSMGVAIEEMTWGSWTPHKVKMGVSGCARNCAEAMVKDFGVVAVENGWDLYVGGSAGYRVRAGKRVARVGSEREVLEYCGAFLQLYRGEGWYGERTGDFVQRVGVDYVRERLVKDPYGRSQLFRTFYRSQHGNQCDPWQEQARGHADDFVPLSRLIRGAPS
jgi:nitrite reductase (NADH) large subunit